MLIALSGLVFADYTPCFPNEPAFTIPRADAVDVPIDAVPKVVLKLEDCYGGTSSDFTLVDAA